ncbi:Os12g0268100 [Oryza sativa Japonica Group]|uniref:Os12g0268100 protein n=2 Tax=Oryza sativa subsp. japonica TaxID=39947 RepID=Q0IP03_ORYSJ|nr:hypothetical protein EE612_058824 [Oryza sativa]BAF29562.1 Os12g0268100 [Oryza sativa Japonica Group]BAT16633.1 Os12g0268100 [Oryza sativa Japonica Group]|eukprot:NP_001066543.1 Os12g0268100 [Oryza sativa Japonica Group]
MRWRLPLMCSSTITSQASRRSARHFLRRRRSPVTVLATGSSSGKKSPMVNPAKRSCASASTAPSLSPSPCGNRRPNATRQSTSLARLRKHSLRSTGFAGEVFLVRCASRRRSSLTLTAPYVATRRADRSSDTTTRRAIRWYGPAGANVTSEQPNDRNWPESRCGRDASAASLVVSAARARSGLEITTAGTLPSRIRNSGARMVRASSASAWCGMPDMRWRCPITGHPGGDGGSRRGFDDDDRLLLNATNTYAAESTSSASDIVDAMVSSISSNTWGARLVQET